ncbi:MAG: hypothetical protein WC869_07450 [Phycisphaerae bacterium]
MKMLEVDILIADPPEKNRAGRVIFDLLPGWLGRMGKLGKMLFQQQILRNNNDVADSPKRWVVVGG